MVLLGSSVADTGRKGRTTRGEADVAAAPRHEGRKGMTATSLQVNNMPPVDGGSCQSASTYRPCMPSVQGLAALQTVCSKRHSCRQCRLMRLAPLPYLFRTPAELRAWKARAQSSVFARALLSCECTIQRDDGSCSRDGVDERRATLVGMHPRCHTVGCLGGVCWNIRAAAQHSHTQAFAYIYVRLLCLLDKV